MPLRAILNGQDYYSENLTEDSRHNKYVCPNCKTSLIPVIPKKQIIKHFRHKVKTNCKPEGEEHLTGKNILRKTVETLGYQAITEYKIGDNITDVYVKSPIPIAIEFQCSKCTTEEILERISAYGEEGIITLWILGSSFLERHKEQESILKLKKTEFCEIEKTVSEYQKNLIYLSRDKKFHIRNHDWIKGFSYPKYFIQYHIKALSEGKPIKTESYFDNSR